jgi:ABC-type Fe3+-hydroxamate transport system substrate-binding protein
MKKRRCAALIICAALILTTVSGCRYSPTLEEIIYNELREGLIDITPPFEIAENKPENEDTSDDLKDLAQDDEAIRETEEESAGVVDTEETETEPDTESGFDTELSENTENTAPAGEAAEETPVDETEGGEDIGIDQDTGDGGVTLEPDATATTYKQVVDAYGKTVEIPENVGSVAATGDTAVMVMMLGGEGLLAAADKSTIANALVSRAFSDVSSVEGLWKSSASGIDAESFERLLELKPDVVIETSNGKVVTDAQVQALSDNGIAYLVLPSLTSFSNISTAVTTMGEVLGDKSSEGGKNAPEIAAQYISWSQSVIKKASSGASSGSGDDDTTASGMYTLFIDGWDDSASYKLYNEQYTTLSGTGCAVIKNGATESCRTLSEFLNYAGVINSGSLYGITKKTLYFTPLISAYRTMDVTGTMAEGMVTAGQKLLEQDTTSLGMSDFPIIIAADKHTAQSIAASELWQVYPHINSGDGSFNSDGFLDEEGNLVRTQISGEYEIAVNPVGLSSWTGGSCESILETVWAAWKFYGTFSESDVRDYISEFYSTFYGYTLSQSELSAILEGN